VSDSKRLFAGPPILPWLRADSKKPLKLQLKKARILKGATLRAGGLLGSMRLPELRLVKPAAAAAAKKSR
jgi:hypothetical protein